MKSIKSVVAVVAAALINGLGGCQKGPGSAGKQVDKVTDKAGEQMERPAIKIGRRQRRQEIAPRLGACSATAAPRVPPGDLRPHVGGRDERSRAWLHSARCRCSVVAYRRLPLPGAAFDTAECETAMEWVVDPAVDVIWDSSQLSTLKPAQRKSRRIRMRNWPPRNRRAAS